MMKIPSLTCALLLSLFLKASSFDLPSFGKGYDVNKFPEELKKNLETFGKFTNDSMNHITEVLNQFKTDYIPDFNEMQKNSTESCVQFARNLAKKVVPAKFSCAKEIPGDLMDKAKKSKREIAPCFGKCVGMKLQILNEDGTPNLPNAKQLIDEIVPPMFMDFVTTIMEKCQEPVLAIKKDDETCETHRAAVKCISNVVSDVSMEALKRCPDIPEGWKKLIVSVADSTKD